MKGVKYKTITNSFSNYLLAPLVCGENISNQLDFVELYNCQFVVIWVGLQNYIEESHFLQN